MIDLLIGPCGQLLTLAGDNDHPRRGPAMSDLGTVEGGMLGVNTGGLIEYAGPADKLPRRSLAKNCQFINAEDKVVMPGFVDSHTHLVFAGTRADEFYRRARGESYQEIARAGGGIAVTMGETRKASEQELARGALKRLIQLVRNGTTTLETKTGYGLDPESEWRSLKTISNIQRQVPGIVFSTYLGAHLIPPEYKDNRQAYVDIVCGQLREIATLGQVDFFDIFVDPLAFSLKESKQIAAAGFEAGLRLRLHADEFGDDGTAAWGVEVGAMSVDHLGGIGDSGIAALASSDTVATLLPATMFFSGHGKFAPARRLIDAGCAVALATDLNPGSSLVYSMPFTMTLAALEMQMSAEECIVASTINGAHALGAADRVGSLEPGKRADVLIIDLPDYREIAYHVGANYVEAVYHAGQLFDPKAAAELWLAPFKT